MLVRFNNDDGSHGYEMIDFRETMPALGNETVSCPTTVYIVDISLTGLDVLAIRS